MGNPVRVQISPRAPSYCSVAGPLPRKRARTFSDAVFAAGAIGGGLGNDPDQLDAETILGAHLVLGAAVLAAHVRPARIFAQMKDLNRSEEARAAHAFHRRVADQLFRLGHRGLSLSPEGCRERFPA